MATQLSDADLARARLRLRARALEASESIGTFRRFVERHNPTLLRYEHVPRLVDVAQRVVDGTLSRVIVMLTPGYFKTEVFSRLLPAYFLRRHPDRHVGLLSYGAELAWSISEDARDRYVEDGGALSVVTKAKKRWRTAARGSMWAAGFGGPSLGFRFDLGVVDDPVDPDQAHSLIGMRRFQSRWPAKFLSRQRPGARIVFVMQRLGTMDPIDFLFRREVGEDTDLAPEHWHVVVCDEVKSDEPLGRWDGPQGLPSTCTIEADPRSRGDVLAPTHLDYDQVIRIQQASGPYVTAAQRQQRPSAPTGDFWREEWFGTYDDLPREAYNGGRDWDTSQSDDEGNAASAFVHSFRGPGKDNEFPIYIHDVDWEWLEFPELIYWMGGTRPLGMNGGPRTPRRSGLTPQPPPHYIEAKSSGKSAAQSLRREGIVVTEVNVKGDKFLRSTLVQPIVAAGRVFVRRSVRRRLLEGERQGLLRVRAETLVAGGPDLDVNDAFVQALQRHTLRTSARIDAGALGGLRQKPAWKVE